MAPKNNREKIEFFRIFFANNVLRYLFWYWIENVLFSQYIWARKKKFVSQKIRTKLIFWSKNLKHCREIFRKSFVLRIEEITIYNVIESFWQKQHFVLGPDVVLTDKKLPVDKGYPQINPILYLIFCLGFHLFFIWISGICPNENVSFARVYSGLCFWRTKNVFTAL
jgi:hypothetical protein